MLVKEIESNDDWEKFNREQSNTLFVQSVLYGEFYERMGERSFLIGIYDNNKIVGGSLVVTTHAKRGNFLYLPYGPILPENDKATSLKIFTDFIVDYAKKLGGYSFVRICPYLQDNAENKEIYKNNKYKTAPMHVLAETTWILDISPSLDELLSKMNKNHRNLIRRCERDGVIIKKTNNSFKLINFFELYNQTAERHKFHKFSSKYIESEFNSFSQSNQAMQFCAYLPGNILDASAIIMYYGNMAAYRHGASLNLNSKLPTSYLLQWEAIKEAKNRGMKYYNFWGIAPDRAKKHPFGGITHFKKGFGGFQTNLLRCQDLTINKKYYLNWAVETIRRLKRGF